MQVDARFVDLERDRLTQGAYAAMLARRKSGDGTQPRTVLVPHPEQQRLACASVLAILRQYGPDERTEHERGCAYLL